MDNLNRFSDYDVFAYIASGLGAIVAWDLVFSTHHILGADWTVATGLLTIAFAYILGQILASPAAWLIERQLVHHLLFRPSVILMGGKELGWRNLLKKSLLQDYYSPLVPELRRKVRKRAAADCGTESSGEILFWCAFPVAKKDANAYARMETFLRLYGFCRNMAFVGLSGACLIVTGAIVEWVHLGWTAEVTKQLQYALFAMLIGCGMLHRYLKFFRLYGVEVLVAYSESSPSGGQSDQ